MQIKLSQQYVCNFHVYRSQYEYESKFECELKSKSNLENILLAIDKK